MEKTEKLRWKSWAPRQTEEKAKDKYETAKNINDYTLIAYGFQHELNTSEPFYRAITDVMKQHFADTTQPLNVLDNGCGVGRFMYDMAEKYPNATFYGIDYSDAMVERANGMVRGKQFEVTKGGDEPPLVIKGRQLNNVTIEQGDARALPFPNAYFDFINSTNLIDRVPDALEVVREMMRVLKPNGRIVVTSPLDFRGFTGAVHYTYEQVIKMFEAFGLQVESATDDLAYAEFSKPNQVWTTSLISGVKKTSDSLFSDVTLMGARNLPIESLAQTYKAIFEYKPWFETWPLEKVKSDLKEVMSFASFDGYGLDLNDETIGFAYGYHLFEREKFQPIAEFAPSVAPGQLFYLSEFGIQPFFQSRGLGKVLMAHLSKAKPIILTRTKNPQMVSLLEQYYSSVEVITHDFIDPQYPDRQWYLCRHL